MSRRAATVGVSLLTGFVVALVFVFFREDAEREAELDGQRRALEAFATSSVRRALTSSWESGVDTMEAALADPLRDDSTLWLVNDGVLVLPRVARGSLEGVGTAVESLVRGAAAVDDGPTGERRRFVEALRRAVETNDAPGLERSVRALLDHRQHFRLGPIDELATLLAMVELLQTKSTPSRVLLEGVLREGFKPSQLGAQRLVLEVAPRLSAKAFDETCALVIRQSQRAAVRVDDFMRRCEQVSRGVSLPSGSPVALTLESGWVARGGTESRGVAVPVEALRSDVQSDMRARGLLMKEDELVLSATVAAVDALTVRVDSPRWVAAARERRVALLLKLALVVLAFALGVGLMLALGRLQRREAALVDAKAELVSTVSHELRTPLASLRVMAETLERKLEHVPEAKQWPARIVGEVDGLSALVENILAFNRIEQGRDVVRLEKWDAGGLEAWLKNDAPEVEVTVRGAPGRVVLADPTWLRVVFANLVRNAQRYNERERAVVSVDVRAEQSGVVFDVQDNGIGIPREKWNEVFEALHRLRDGRGRGGGGSGLGLAIVRRVVEAHGGTVQIVSSSNEGTCFRVTLRAS